MSCHSEEVDWNDHFQREIRCCGDYHAAQDIESTVEK